MKIGELQRNWDQFGRMDPLWAILTVHGKRGGKWDLAEFFRTGEEDIASLLRYVESLRFPLRRNRALDFGCGVGRLTQALCPPFAACCGVDIAPSMIEQANQYNRHPQKCRYFVNADPDLRLFESNYFDLVYSVITLQHMAPEYSTSYIREFVRVLAPGGLLVFQVPSEPADPASALGAVADEPLPDDAFRARLCAARSPIEAEAGSLLTIPVRVTNRSPVRWPLIPHGVGKREILLGNHWHDAQHVLLVNDDGRAPLPAELGPGETAEIPLTVTVPPQPGRYVLELDMVQEFVGWFGRKGSQTEEVTVEVRPRNAARPAPPAAVLGDTEPQAPAVPQMEMHCVPKETVLKLLEESGGRMVDVYDDGAVGANWRSYRYAVTK